MEDAGISARDIDEVILVGGMTRMPRVQQKALEIFEKEPHKAINPDEVVAIGAAIQGGILRGDVMDVILLDVTPLSLGIETLGGLFTKIMEKNTTIPVRKSQIFSTASDNQTAVCIHGLQGEREMAKDNRTLARFELYGIPPAPRGVPQIDVTFDIDVNGIVHVYAKDLGTQKEAFARVSASSGLSEEEIEHMIKEAMEHSEDDRLRRDIIEARNALDALIYYTDRYLRDYEEKIGAEERERMAVALDAAREAMKVEADDPEFYRAAYKDLSMNTHALTEAMYE
jgi:molecular chaperone DnaK